MNTDLPPEAYAAALASFPHMSIHRLGALLRHHAPSEAYADRGWRATVRRVDRASARRLRRPRRLATGRSLLVARRGVGALHAAGRACARARRRVDYPALLLDDPLPPPVVFAQGDLGLLDGRRAAIVGTRNATAAGRDTATTLGRQLADADVHVVSGLARGIDGCAHRGALQTAGAGRPIAVVASGHDVVYPREHRACGVPSPSRVCCCPRRHPARRRRPTGSRCAIG